MVKEVAMVREEGMIVHIIAYSSGNYTAVSNAGRLYAWNWDNLTKLLG